MDEEGVAAGLVMGGVGEGGVGGTFQSIGEQGRDLFMIQAAEGNGVETVLSSNVGQGLDQGVGFCGTGGRQHQQAVDTGAYQVAQEQQR
jgi:hypothetical protein